MMDRGIGTGSGAERPRMRGAQPLPCPAAIQAQLLDQPEGKVKAVVQSRGEGWEMLLLLSAITEAVGVALGKPKAAILDMIARGTS